VIRNSKGKELKQVQTFKYLGSVVSATGGCEEDVLNTGLKRPGRNGKTCQE